MISFETNDRAITNDDGTMEYVPWTALCNGYKANDYDILMPTRLRQGGIIRMEILNISTDK